MANVRGDVRGDGRSDFYWVAQTSAGLHTALMEWNGSGFSWVYLGFAARPWFGFLDGDFSNDADAAADVIYVNQTTREVGYRNYDAALGASWQSLGVYGEGFDVWDKGDYTGDGTDDVLFFQRDVSAASLPARIGFWDVDNGVVTRWVDLGTVGVGWTPYFSADYNSDGRTDIFWHNVQTGENGFWYFDTSGGYTWQALQTVATGPDSWQLWSGADVTGDGRIEAFWTKVSASGTDIGMWDLSSGQAVWRYLGQAPNGWQFINAEDFTGDGAADILLQNANGDFGFWDFGVGANYERWVYAGRDQPGDEWTLFY